MEHSRGLLAAFLLLCGGAVVLAQGPERGQGRKGPELPAILKKVQAEADRISFAGIREVFMKRPGGEAFRSRERVLRQGRKSRIEFRPESPFAGQIIVEDGRKRFHYFPDKNEAHERPVFFDPLGVGPGFPDPGRGRNRGAKYVVQPGSERVAGIATTVVALEASEGRVLQKLWVDGARGLVLRRRAFGPKGEELAGFDFLSIKFNPPIPPRAFELPSRDVKVVTTDAMLLREAAQMDFPAFRLPSSSGYRLIGVRRVDSEAMKFLWQTYRQGRNRLTLFILKGAVDGSRLSRLAGGGRVNSHTWTRDGYTLVLLGSLSQDDLRAAAQTVVPAR